MRLARRLSPRAFVVGYVLCAYWAVACARENESAPIVADAGTTFSEAREVHGPPGCAGPLERTTATRFYDGARCLFEGLDPVQRDVRAGTISEERVAIVRGRVTTRAGEPLGAVRVAVLGGPEYGFTLTRADGYYDLAVNGGGKLTLRFEREGFLRAQRHQQTAWRRFAVFDDVALLEPSAPTPRLPLSELRTAAWIRGPRERDASGERSYAALVRPGTSALASLADGSQQALATLSVRMTEYTVGAAGPRTMPADLPATSAYTYAVELSVVEADALGAVGVAFSPALTTYVDNFLHFPAGTVVPNGSYDAARDEWTASESGLVIDLVGAQHGLAQLDLDADGAAEDPETLAARGFDEEELAALARAYPDKCSLWRLPISHFSTYDHNWPARAPADATRAQVSLADHPSDGCGPKRSGSIIGCEEQSLGERFPIVGTPYALHYQSERMPGRLDAYELEIQLSTASVPSTSSHGPPVEADRTKSDRGAPGLRAGTYVLALATMAHIASLYVNARRVRR